MTGKKENQQKIKKAKRKAEAYTEAEAEAFERRLSKTPKKYFHSKFTKI